MGTFLKRSATSEFPAHILLRRGSVLPRVPNSPQILIKILTSADELLQARPMWESLCATGNHTVFQSLELNVLAALMFSAREEPFIVCAEASYGSAIIPAVVRHAD